MLEHASVYSDDSCVGVCVFVCVYYSPIFVNLSRSFLVEAGKRISDHILGVSAWIQRDNQTMYSLHSIKGLAGRMGGMPDFLGTAQCIPY